MLEGQAVPITAENTDVIWVRKLGKTLMWGRVDALDDGWSHNGKFCRFRVQINLAHGACLVMRKRMYILFWSTP